MKNESFEFSSTINSCATKSSYYSSITFLSSSFQASPLPYSKFVLILVCTIYFTSNMISIENRRNITRDSTKNKGIHFV